MCSFASICQPADDHEHYGREDGVAGAGARAGAGTGAGTGTTNCKTLDLELELEPELESRSGAVSLEATESLIGQLCSAVVLIN